MTEIWKIGTIVSQELLIERVESLLKRVKELEAWKERYYRTRR